MENRKKQSYLPISKALCVSTVRRHDDAVWGEGEAALDGGWEASRVGLTVSP